MSRVEKATGAACHGGRLLLDLVWLSLGIFSAEIEALDK
jgi:hypothetical protein